MSSPASDPPPEPTRDDTTPRPLMSVGFWVALAFGLACVLAGLAVVVLAGRGAL